MANFLHRNQDNATIVDLKAGIRTATVIYEVYVFTTKMFIAINLYRPLGRQRTDLTFEPFYDISPRYSSS
ncbi:hypothetical protein [Bradyrhizobium sp. 193]|uniref:hypothetical protein n=1 Tax=Bradyrhizobium sp. 193 TaxID=2782661 RepID=UPI001FF913A0|nr:hypothetical protein [Bradyrhizobium sp. 193]